MKNIDKHLPLTETTAYILLALGDPLHGYGVMQLVKTLSEDKVTIGAGTLYTAFVTLEKQGLIEKAGQNGRRKLYILTAFGHATLAEHIRRTVVLVKQASIVIAAKESETL